MEISLLCCGQRWQRAEVFEAEKEPGVRRRVAADGNRPRRRPRPRLWTRGVSQKAGRNRRNVTGLDGTEPSRGRGRRRERVRLRSAATSLLTSGFWLLLWFPLNSSLATPILAAENEAGFNRS